MLEREIVMGGEESGGIGFQRHLPERDGLLNALLLANVIAMEGKPLGQLVADLQAEYGEHQYGRIDLHIPEDVKNGAIARAKALNLARRFFPECRFFARRRWTASSSTWTTRGEDEAQRRETWLLLRASGTEPLMRIYCESCSKESVAKLLESARSLP